MPGRGVLVAVLIEAISVVVLRHRIVESYPGGWAAFKREVPNGTLCYDTHLARVGFMSSQDVRHWVKQLEMSGLSFEVEERAVDMAVVDQLQGLTVRCDWLRWGELPIDDAFVAAAWVPSDTERHLATPAEWSFHGSLSDQHTFIPEEDELSHRFDVVGEGSGVLEIQDKMTGARKFLGSPFDQNEEVTIKPPPPRLGDIGTLFFNARRFFSSFDLDRPSWYRSILLLYGIARASDELIKLIWRAEQGLGSPDVVEPLMGVMESWLAYWAWIMGLGLFAAITYWYIGGWWYRLRLGFSGVVDPDPRTARLVMTYSSLCAALPIFAALVMYTLVFPSYGAFWSAERGIVSDVLVMFPVWAISVSYLGVSATFEASVWKSRVWFLFLPVLLFMAGIGAFSGYYHL